ncbi:efflux RND transporter permease subunit [Stieleria sp. ICT_E10.1]|uniref:efflux RND transporter permease subunit n=1 Tax=Stieleria sedimenti TaxID=2976331 RepID=UPI00217F757A|nr:efflux RND transporter permease subunit [Stieleria sedimenti]MCS7470531.1 efflux RND transporter permease subunit [Stieleria sedimenti]
MITQIGRTEAVMVLLDSGPLSTGDLKIYCEDLKDRLQQVPQVSLRDLGRVVDVFEDEEVKSLLGSERAGVLRIEKTKTQDAIRVTTAVREFLELERQRQPLLDLVVVNDMSTLIRDRLQLVLKNAVQGIVLVFCTLWMFFNLRMSFWVVMSLPVSFLGALFLMPMLGLTINMITLVAMLLATGILMDDGIVISENIARHLSLGKPAMRAAIDGVKEVSGGVLSSFLTTICVLGPLASLSGVIGKVLEVIPMVLILVLAVILIEAFIILPAHLGHSLGHTGLDRPGRLRRGIDQVLRWLRESVTGNALSIPSVLGFVSLAGVVVNDSILLVLFLKQERTTGADVEDSARRASRLRFRAILLTSATTIAGCTPLLFETSRQAQVLIPLAVSVCFGLLSSTVLVLIAIPAAYVVLADFGLVTQATQKPEDQQEMARH